MSSSSDSPSPTEPSSHYPTPGFRQSPPRRDAHIHVEHYSGSRHPHHRYLHDHDPDYRSHSPHHHRRSHYPTSANVLHPPASSYFPSSHQDQEHPRKRHRASSSRSPTIPSHVLDPSDGYSDRSLHHPLPPSPYSSHSSVGAEYSPRSAARGSMAIGSLLRGEGERDVKPSTNGRSASPPSPLNPLKRRMDYQPS